MPSLKLNGEEVNVTGAQYDAVARMRIVVNNEIQRTFPDAPREPIIVDKNDIIQWGAIFVRIGKPIPAKQVGAKLYTMFKGLGIDSKE